MSTRSLVGLLALAPVLTGCILVVEEGAGPEPMPLSGSPWLRTPESPSLAGVRLMIEWQAPAPPQEIEPELTADGVWVARDPRTARAWLRYEGQEDWSAAWVEGVSDYAAVRVLPIYGLPGIDDDFALIAGGRAYTRNDDEGTFDELALERADADPGLSDGAALDATRQLRYLRACPGSYETCLLFGPEDAVAAAEDPARPEGGWSLVEARRPVDLRRDELELLYELDEQSRVRLLTWVAFDWESDPDEAELAVSRSRVVFFHGGREHVAFDFELSDDWGIEEDVISGGVERLSDAWMVWLWDADRVLLGVSFHELTTGERLMEPLVVQGEPYDELECVAGLYETRPLPVLGRDGLLVAITWQGVEEAILFEPPMETGARVPLARDVEADLEQDGLPPYLVLGEDGSLR